MLKAANMKEADLFKNCLNIVETDRGLRPERFTPKQFEAYTSTEALHIRSVCTSGTMLDMITDSTFLAFEYSIGEYARDWLYFDVFINGVLVGCFGTDPIEERSGLFRYDWGGKYPGINRVTCYLPHLSEMYIRNLQFSENASIETAPAEKGNLLCLGDSITQGMDAKRPSSTYPVMLSQCLGMNLLNQGVGGYIFDKASLDRHMPYHPDLITVAYGTNDWNQISTLGELRDRCHEYVQELSDGFPHAQIAVMTPIWREDMGEVQSMGSFKELCQTIASVCSEIPRVRAINGLSLIPHLPCFFGDKTVHPNEEGFAHMALGIIKQLQSAKY